ncbi:AAA family ATPase [Coprococcus catus]|nr:PD-(D/E)XK nuclease domain-containing protein [Coprococcus catus]MBT9772843.1 AAA family ATPase [Coprococcus catus]
MKGRYIFTWRYTCLFILLNLFTRPRRFGKTLNMSMLRYFFELKYAKLFSGMAKACESAMTQIHQRRYDDYLRNDGRENVLAYGIAFCKKRCKVVAERMK